MARNSFEQLGQIYICSANKGSSTQVTVNVDNDDPGGIGIIFERHGSGYGAPVIRESYSLDALAARVIANFLNKAADRKSIFVNEVEEAFYESRNS